MPGKRKTSVEHKSPRKHHRVSENRPAAELGCEQLAARNSEDSDDAPSSNQRCFRLVKEALDGSSDPEIVHGREEQHQFIRDFIGQEHCTAVFALTI